MVKEFRKYTNKKLDGRFKITPDMYPKVKAKYKELKSSRKTAECYNVTKNVILRIVDPSFKERESKQRIRDKVWLRYHDTRKRKLYMRKYRNKKRVLNHQYNNINN